MGEEYHGRLKEKRQWTIQGKIRTALGDSLQGFHLGMTTITMKENAYMKKSTGRNKMWRMAHIS